MKIAIAVHGRFYAFELAAALIRRGHDVRVFTNYPKWATRRFKLADENVRSFWIHGLLARTANRLERVLPFLRLDFVLHPLFGRWAARHIAREKWCVIHVFSGVAEEILRSSDNCCLRTVVRGSAHIRTQDRLLAEEQVRCGQCIERPTPWTIKREEREYKLADRVVVLSTFAQQSFMAESVSAEKILLLPLGVDTRHFRPNEETVSERCRRIRAGKPLRVLTVGRLSFQKGLLDLRDVVQHLHDSRFQFRFVGDSHRAERKWISASGPIEFVPTQPQLQLRQSYDWADLFLFPTIHDGFAVVLAQASASALPILTTTNCAGPDMVREGETGWVVPIRQPDALIDRLEWCHANRDTLAEMVLQIYHKFQPRDWDDVARDFERFHEHCRMSVRYC